MVDGGAMSSSRRGGSSGDAARKQQMAIENAILEAVLKRSKGASKQGDDQDRDDYGGVRDRVEDLISSIVGLEHIKCQVSFIESSDEFVILCLQ